MRNANTKKRRIFVLDLLYIDQILIQCYWNMEPLQSDVLVPWDVAFMSSPALQWCMLLHLNVFVNWVGKGCSHEAQMRGYSTFVSRRWSGNKFVKVFIYVTEVEDNHNIIIGSVYFEKVLNLSLCVCLCGVCLFLGGKCSSKIEVTELNICICETLSGGTWHPALLGAAVAQAV
jgi:hypothetical protein